MVDGLSEAPVEKVGRKGVGRAEALQRRVHVASADQLRTGVTHFPRFFKPVMPSATSFQYLTSSPDATRSARIL